MLAHVFPDGRVNLIQDGILRTAFRDPDKSPQLNEPGRIYALDIALWATSYLVDTDGVVREIFPAMIHMRPSWKAVLNRMDEILGSPSEQR